MKLANNPFKSPLVANQIETALSGDFLAVFGHEADFVRFEKNSLASHGDSRGHLQIKGNKNGARQIAHIRWLNVTTIFTQMDGDRIDPGLLRQTRRFEHVRLRRETPFPMAIANLAKSRHMIDIES